LARKCPARSFKVRGWSLVGRIAMSKVREKAEARTKQFVGQMMQDDKLVQEGKEQEQDAERAEEPVDENLRRRAKRNQRSR
jgi:hypothetical protein